MCSSSFLMGDILESYRSGENLIPLLHSSVRKIVPETRASRSFWNINLTHTRKSRGTDYSGFLTKDILCSALCVWSDGLAAADPALAKTETSAWELPGGTGVLHLS